MTDRHDADHRLGRGLKRWAEAGQPTLDLETYVKARTPEPPGETTGTAMIGGAAAAKQPRRWHRLAGGFAAAAALALALTATFPAWAGAAATWPLVGPVLTEIILKDAGLKWAYDNGLIQGTLAEAKEGDVTVRILGAVANARQTTVIYQIVGAPSVPDDARRVAPGGLLGPPHIYPQLTVAEVDSKVSGSWGSAPVKTPVGLVGTVSTTPLSSESARLLVKVSFGAKTVGLPIEASRAAVDKLSREIAVNRSQEIDGVNFTVESVIYTPAETVVRYREEKAYLNFGPWRTDPGTEMAYIESQGKRYSMSGGNAASINGVNMVAFPPVKGPVSFIIPVAVKGVETDVVWPLKPGATQQVGGVTITLVGWEHAGDVVSFNWEYAESQQMVGFGTFEALDASGNAHPLGVDGSGEGNNLSGAGTMERHFYAKLPADFTPVAVRARVIGHKVIGPWRFALPQ